MEFKLSENEYKEFKKYGAVIDFVIPFTPYKSFINKVGYFVTIGAVSYFIIAVGLYMLKQL